MDLHQPRGHAGRPAAYPDFYPGGRCYHPPRALSNPNPDTRLSNAYSHLHFYAYLDLHTDIYLDADLYVDVHGDAYAASHAYAFPDVYTDAHALAGGGGALNRSERACRPGYLTSAHYPGASGG